MEARVVVVEDVPEQRNDSGFAIRWLLRERFGNLGLAVAHTIIPPGGSSGFHVREKAAEVLFYLGGRATVEVKGGETHTMEPGTLIVIPPGVTHCHTNQGDEPITQFFVQAETD
jgi:quercetin dioxygenase-like cupin family protein